MAPQKFTPDENEFRRWLAEGLTHQQMADRVYARTGRRVTRAAISVAICGYGLSRPTPRYKRELPWRVRTPHGKSYPARMLRLLGKRHLGLCMTKKDSRDLDNWLRNIKVEGVIVAYDPDSDQGFFYIDERFRDHGDLTLPIRIRRLRNTDGPMSLTA